METAPLESFAIRARTDLISEVTARIAAVLAPGSTERVEKPRAVAALEQAVDAAGGGVAGRSEVADQGAYTWFNRFVALRFMDANGFTGIGVVSPPSRVEAGQPEILAAAKNGVIDADVVRQATRTAVVGLLDGTRGSNDPQGEAYALLLAEYCRYWNSSMPFMFAPEGNFTELLTPANLLADDSVIDRLGKVLTKDVCKDVEVIGWLYQFYISERMDEVFAGFKKNKKAGANEIPAVTQIFTPDWIVRYLVENSLGRLWMLNRPTSSLVNQMDYYIAPVDQEADFLKITKPEELKIIDPACGSGHMLTYAFDLLYAIYEEEGYAPSDIPGLILMNNLYGTEIDQRAGSLAAFALTMKARGKQRTFFSKQVEPNICVIEPISFAPDEIEFLIKKDGDRHEEIDFWHQFAEADTRGSLTRPDSDMTARLGAHLEKLDDGGDMLKAEAIARARRVVSQAEYLLTGYSVVVANPPYMGKRNMNDDLRNFAETNFPVTKSDLCTMFIERALEMVALRGLAALVVSESWLFNSAYEDMRIQIVRDARLRLSACIDKAAFGVRLNTAASILERGGDNADSIFFRVPKEVIEEDRLGNLPPAGQTVFTVDLSSFDRVPGGAFIFDMPSPLLALYKIVPTIGDGVNVKQGLATTDNKRFLRQWFEVSLTRIAVDVNDGEEAQASGKRWFPYNKGGTPSPWYGNQNFVVNWESDGREIKDNIVSKYPYLNGSWGFVAKNPDCYFKPSVTWSNIGSGGARFRSLPSGYIFDVAGMSAFPTSETQMLALLGYLNSSLVRKGLDVIAPTLNYQIGDVQKLPLLVAGGANEECVKRLVDLSREACEEEEIAHAFRSGVWGRASSGSLEDRVGNIRSLSGARIVEIESLERDNDLFWTQQIIEQSGIAATVDQADISVARRNFSAEGLAEDLVSYAVGCMFGRYSLDEPGLILADQGSTLQEYLAKVRSPTFTPDADNVLPIVDGDWFEDDIVARFRQFLRAAFGEKHFEENLRFVTESLGVKDLRDYFVKSFYKDHVQRYKKRPIYWLFSSPKGSFNALIYLHRYTASTVSTMLNDYLREFQSKLRASLENAVGSNDAKEADRLRKVLLEIDEYEHEVLYPLAAQSIVIDLDDGVKVNYPKFGSALKKIPGLEGSE